MNLLNFVPLFPFSEAELLHALYMCGYSGYQTYVGIRNYQSSGLDFAKDDVSPELQSQVREILQKVGIENASTIQIKKLRPYLRTVGLGENMFVYKNAVIIDEEYWHQRPLEELEGLLAHEAMHLLHNDNLVKLISYTLLPLIAYGSSYYLREKFGLMPASVFACCITFLFKQLSNYAGTGYSRCIERRADLESVRKLGSSKGLIAFLQNDETRKKTAQMSWLNKVFLSHPTNDVRIAYLQAEQENFDAEKAEATDNAIC